MRQANKAITLCFLCGVLSIFAGCGIGYNRTLFITKTNVGFEASAEPPTFELDISRLEGTVGPQFENGKKLPVMEVLSSVIEGHFLLLLARRLPQVMRLQPWQHSIMQRRPELDGKSEPIWSLSGIVKLSKLRAPSHSMQSPRR